jgi:hypothetical protein
MLAIILRPRAKAGTRDERKKKRQGTKSEGLLVSEMGLEMVISAKQVFKVDLQVIIGIQ